MISEEVKREIGQHFVFGFHGFEPSADIIKLIRDYYLGSVIIFKRNIKNLSQLQKLIQSLQQIAKDAGHIQPLLIGIDQENGVVSAFSSAKTDAGTQFPGAMALGSTGDPKLAEKVAKSSGREMRLTGINWVYSPVGDVNSDPRNPVIGVRSYAEDARTAASFVCAASEGFTTVGIAPCAKHFPGHGDTHVDSHLALPIITKDLATLEETELVPFRAAIGKGIASIMTGHMAIPPLISALGEDADTNIPASLSRGVTTTLLKEKIGFEGVVVTDCLEMNAISEGYGCGPGAVMALKAGADIVMICHRIDRHLAALEATYSAVESGELSPEFLRTSGMRVKILKDKFCGRWDDVINSPLDSAELAKIKQENIGISRDIYALSTKWISPPKETKELVISPHSDVLLLTPQMESINAAVDDPEDLLRTVDGATRNTAGPSFNAFAKAMARRAPFSTHLVYTPKDGEGNMPSTTLEKSILSVHVVVFATRNAHQSRWQLAVLRRVIEAANSGVEGKKEKPIKLIVVASCAPYDYDLLVLDEKTRKLPCLCTYEHTKPALEEAAAKLYGENLAGQQK